MEMLNSKLEGGSKGVLNINIWVRKTATVMKTFIQSVII